MFLQVVPLRDLPLHESVVCRRRPLSCPDLECRFRGGAAAVLGHFRGAHTYSLCGAYTRKEEGELCTGIMTYRVPEDRGDVGELSGERKLSCKEMFIFLIILRQFLRYLALLQFWFSFTDF